MGKTQKRSNGRRGKLRKGTMGEGTRMVCSVKTEGKRKKQKNSIKKRKKYNKNI